MSNSTKQMLAVMGGVNRHQKDNQPEKPETTVSSIDATMPVPSMSDILTACLTKKDKHDLLPT